MRIRDYEQAIEALDSTIKMEEAKINKGQVRCFFGHKDDTDIMWDDNGFGYTKSNNEDAVREPYVRNEMYDLKFE